MKKKSPVIGDIAKKSGVSKTTISFILNGKAKEMRISHEVEEKVMSVVQELGYVPNSLAKSLRTGKSNIIGLIVEDISNPFFAHIARKIEERANHKGYKLFYCSSENDAKKTSELIRLFRDRQVDGYIITPAEGIEKDIELLLDDDSPLVLFDRYLPGIDTNYVIIDNFESTYKAIHHFVDKGYKNIAFITLDSEQIQMTERLSGYKKALSDHHLKPFIKKIPFLGRANNYTSQIASFLRENDVDAIFFATNYLAISGLEAIVSLHKNIPDDIGVIAFDDHDLFRLFDPSITAIEQPVEQISEQLIDVILNDLNNSADTAIDNKIILPAHLTIRESSQRRKK
ncbi:MAG: LacI family DNA-binding transcriptional regulator [Ginsengibacter sp.]